MTGEQKHAVREWAMQTAARKTYKFENSCLANGLQHTCSHLQPTRNKLLLSCSRSSRNLSFHRNPNVPQGEVMVSHRTLYLLTVRVPKPLWDLTEAG